MALTSRFQDTRTTRTGHAQDIKTRTKARAHNPPYLHFVHQNSKNTGDLTGLPALCTSKMRPSAPKCPENGDFARFSCTFTVVCFQLPGADEITCSFCRFRGGLPSGQGQHKPKSQCTGSHIPYIGFFPLSACLSGCLIVALSARPLSFATSQHEPAHDQCDPAHPFQDDGGVA